jgi:hypothetical protein
MLGVRGDIVNGIVRYGAANNQASDDATKVFGYSPRFDGKSL